jgi:hypothetical protein
VIVVVKEKYRAVNVQKSGFLCEKEENQLRLNMAIRAFFFQAPALQDSLHFGISVHERC